MGPVAQLWIDEAWMHEQRRIAEAVPAAEAAGYGFTPFREMIQGHLAYEKNPDWWVRLFSRYVLHIESNGLQDPLTWARDHLPGYFWK